MIRPARGDAAWLGFIVHRISGIALALFLPLHFWALSRAISGEAALQGFIAWTANPLVKFAEWALVVLLAAHLAGGLRVMALEFLGWRAAQKNLVAASAGFALAIGLIFALHVG
jgi:fumarate reductase subunit D